MSFDELVTKALFNDNYKLQKFLGKGGFGRVYKCLDQKRNLEVAIKVETTTQKSPRLLYEGNVYRMLENGKGIPKIYWYGRDGIYNVMVMEVLGPSIKDMFKLCNNNFSMKTVLMLGDEVLGRIKFCHEKRVLHRDIKPANLLTGLGDMSKLVYLADFGLAKKYTDPLGNHIPFRQRRGITGTPRFASVNAHRGLELSRRDDLESVGYMMMQLLNRNVPWMLMKNANDNQTNERELEKQLSTPVEDICSGLPPEFTIYLKYCRTLKFDEVPDYSKLRFTFRTLLQNLGFKLDFEFDWISMVPKTVKAGR